MAIRGAEEALDSTLVAFPETHDIDIETCGDRLLVRSRERLNDRSDLSTLYFNRNSQFLESSDFRQ